MAESRISRVGEEVAKHTAWHFTGAPLLDALTEKWKKKVISVLLSALGLVLAGIKTHLQPWWIVTVACEAAALIWMVWSFLGVSERRVAEPTDPASSTPPVPQPPVPAPIEDVAPDAPNPLVEYRSSGARHELILTTDKDRHVITPSIGPLACAERYGAEYEITTIPRILSQVSTGSPVTCQIAVRDPHTGSIVPLVDILRQSSPEGSASVFLSFKDSDDNEFSRLFTVHRNVDDSVTWIPGPVTLKGKRQAPIPGIGNLAKLRARLSLADNFPDEQKAAQQYLREAEEARKKIESLESQLRAWPQAVGIYCLAQDAERLRYRFMGTMMTPDFEPTFRDDFARLKGRIAEKVSIEMATYNLPEALNTDETKSEIQGLLWRTIGALNNYAASLLGMSESPTRS